MQGKESMLGKLKPAILENQFLHRLRTQAVIDQAEYTKLCDALRNLAKLWRSETLIDKELVQELYILAPTTRYQAEALEHRPDLRTQIGQLAIELDNLVMECLASEQQ
jgi:hypothetical protein